ALVSVDPELIVMFAFPPFQVAEPLLTNDDVLLSASPAPVTISTVPLLTSVPLMSVFAPATLKLSRPPASIVRLPPPVTSSLPVDNDPDTCPLPLGTAVVFALTPPLFESVPPLMRNPESVTGPAP